MNSTQQIHLAKKIDFSRFINGRSGWKGVGHIVEDAECQTLMGIYYPLGNGEQGWHCTKDCMVNMDVGRYVTVIFRMHWTRQIL